MEDAALPSSEQRSSDHCRAIPERPRKTPISPASLPRISTLRLVGQEIDRLKGDELVSSLTRNLETPNESDALASMNDVLEQSDKLSVLARLQSSTNFPTFTHASRPNDMDMVDTWLLPMVQGNTKRRSLFKFVWAWLKGS